ncbi:hypothetical protein FXV83_28680 [Bradyrhizobium hipponense]|uniref:Uncharacterized protein n=1 Tax=Bradyrhizobium hipponense TaxID=2605638 RepID=A0A5S4YGZ1_9BRAD|nr:YciI family protein [Bradyrhizobium hipponense]TYO63303.1 hypothetical protein FXV83_28680 [Bradyrhizobium hipponense]
MSTEHTFLAIYLGSMTGTKMAAWQAMPEAERKAKEQEGMAAWHGWVEKHKAVIVELGGPLGKTRRIDASGVTEVSNALTGFTVVRAASQEAAAELFKNHPHFTIFPGEAIEVMPVLPIPGR